MTTHLLVLATAADGRCCGNLSTKRESDDTAADADADADSLSLMLALLVALRLALGGWWRRIFCHLILSAAGDLPSITGLYKYYVE